MEPYRGSDDKWWVRARCTYCTKEKSIRWSHVCPGVSRPPLSCGCVHRDLVTCFLGRRLGRDVVVMDDGAPHIVLACPRGHTWEVLRKTASERCRWKNRGSTLCQACKVAGTIDLTGGVFGRLRVLGRAGTDTPADGRFRGQATWRVQCLCGTVKAVRGAHLRRGAVKTCGAPACRAR